MGRTDQEDTRTNAQAAQQTRHSRAGQSAPTQAPGAGGYDVEAICAAVWLVPGTTLGMYMPLGMDGALALNIHLGMEAYMPQAPPPLTTCRRPSEACDSGLPARPARRASPASPQSPRPLSWQ